MMKIKSPLAILEMYRNTILLIMKTIYLYSPLYLLRMMDSTKINLSKKMIKKRRISISLKLFITLRYPQTIIHQG